MNLIYNTLLTIILAIGAMIAMAVLVVIPFAIFIAWLIVREDRTGQQGTTHHTEEDMINVRAAAITKKIMSAQNEDELWETLRFIRGYEDDYAGNDEAREEGRLMRHAVDRRAQEIFKPEMMAV